jgi:uncharacterized protein (TIGR03083 family)
VTDVDTIISALRSEHDDLAGVVSNLSTEDLARTSAASEWDVSQVISHLGSGAEITQAGLAAALAGEEPPAGDFNTGVWARWDAMSRQERAEGFLSSSEVLTELYESLDPETKRGLRINLGFLPQPISLAQAGGMRLNELSLHSWDVRATFDPSATLHPSGTAALLPGPTMLIGWIAKPDRLDGHSATVAVTTSSPDATFTLHLGDEVSLGDAGDGAGVDTLHIPAEAWLRLLTGRLAPDHTPEGIETTGSTDLELLRKVFPGY